MSACGLPLKAELLTSKLAIYCIDVIDISLVLLLVAKSLSPLGATSILSVCFATLTSPSFFPLEEKIATTPFSNRAKSRLPSAETVKSIGAEGSFRLPMTSDSTAADATLGSSKNRQSRVVKCLPKCLTIHPPVLIVLLTDNLCRETIYLCVGITPCFVRNSSFLTGVSQELFAIPIVFSSHLREEHSSCIPIYYIYTVGANFNFIRIRYLLHR